MNPETLLKLIDAGYTKDEISAMFFTPGKTNEETDREVAQETNDSEPNIENEPHNEPNNNEEIPSYVSSMIKSIDTLTKTIQASNVLNSAKDTPLMTVDEAADAALTAFLKS